VQTKRSLFISRILAIAHDALHKLRYFEMVQHDASVLESDQPKANFQSEIDRWLYFALHEKADKNSLEPETAT
jgi:hypothetical protein